MEQQLLSKRLKWFLISRLAVAITGLVAIWIYQKGQWAFPPHILAIYLILIFACLINIFYLLLISWIQYLPALRIMALFQVGIDILLISGLCYFTGGVGSIFAYLYFAVIVAAALLISAKAGLGLASFTTVLLAGITLAYTLAAQLHFVMPFIPEKYLLTTAREIKFIIPYLFFFGLSLHLVAWLAGRLTIELTRERILKTDILQNMLHGLIVVDRKGMVAFWNPKASEMLRLSPSIKLTGERIDKILADSKYQHLQTALLNNLRTNQTLEFQDTKGEKVYLEINTSVLEDKSRLRSGRGTIAVLADITLKKQMEETIKQSERLQSLREMSASLAHEVRNPLSSIKGAVQALNTYLGNNLKDDEHKLMDLVIKESDRLNKIVTDFLDFASKNPMVPQRTNITELIEEVVTLLRRTRPEPERFRASRSIHLSQSPTLQSYGDEACYGERINLEVDFPPSLICNCDPAGLKQVFLNLGLNALEASSAKGKVKFRGYWSYQNTPLEPITNISLNPVSSTTPITSSTSQNLNAQTLRTLSPSGRGPSGRGPQDERVSELGITLEVIDQGKGVKKEYLSRIFEPFFTTKPRGVGLGLSVAHRIIQEHQGKIWCVPNSEIRNRKSEIGLGNGPPACLSADTAGETGTRFIIWIPSRPVRDRSPLGDHS